MPDSPRRLWIAPTFTIAWMALSTCVAFPVIGGVLLGVVGVRGIPGPDTDPTDLFGPGLLAGLTVIQFAAMLLPAVVLALLLPLGDRSLVARAAVSFPIQIGPKGYLIAAIILGFTAGALPSWAVDQLARATGGEMGITRIIEALDQADPLARFAMYAVVAAIAPVAEELIFRGFLWAAIERSGPPWVAWVATSLLFAAYHHDPLQVLAVLPLGLVLGWLRWRTRSLWASLLLHVTNNGLALITAMAFPDLLTEFAPSVGLAAVAGITLAAAWRFERPIAPAPR